MDFTDMPLSRPLLTAIANEGYDTPTPIQAEAIPPAVDGRDILGCARTGTGKTAAFALPILHLLLIQPPRRGTRPIRALVLTPTRELAAQVGDSFRTYGARTQIRTTTIFGGVNQNPQTTALQRGVDVLVATPGRLLDLINQGYVHLDQLDFFVLDEADRMLDMGFLPDIRKVIKLIPRERQTLFFSATMPPPIKELADTILTDPVHISVDPPDKPATRIRQELYFVERKEKINLLIHLLRHPSMHKILVFTRTKYGADKVVRKLRKAGVSAEAIHGNKSQNARTRALGAFKSDEIDVLVATDIAARGIDVEDISHVVNFDLPLEQEVYVHRIGRTARAGQSGIAYSFCCEEEFPVLVDVERFLQAHIPRAGSHPLEPDFPPPPPTELTRPRRSTPPGRAARPDGDNSRRRRSGGRRPRSPQGENKTRRR